MIVIIYIYIYIYLRAPKVRPWARKLPDNSFRTRRASCAHVGVLKKLASRSLAAHFLKDIPVLGGVDDHEDDQDNYDTVVDDDWEATMTMTTTVVDTR